MAKLAKTNPLTHSEGELLKAQPTEEEIHQPEKDFSFPRCRLLFAAKQMAAALNLPLKEVIC